MFLKPFRVKTCTTIKSSDRKKWKNRFENAFGLQSEELDKLISNKCEVTVAKLQTYSGAIANVFCVQKNPYFFEVDEQLFPTVYTLWKYPNLMLTFTTWPMVFSKLSGGADLMLPGIILANDREMSPTSYGKFEKGKPCAVNLADNKAPVAVGRTAHCSFDMYMAARRGKGVIILHSYMDQLWEYGDKTLIPSLEPPFSIPADNEKLLDEDDTEDENSQSEVAVDDKPQSQFPVCDQLQTEVLEAEKSQCGYQESEITTEIEAEENIKPMGEIATNKHEEVEEPKRFATMDEVFCYTFLKTLKIAGKDISLPILTSTFYKTQMLPNCPAGFQLDVKKTSYKKLGKFLQSMQEDGIVEIKELTKGVESLVTVNFSHESLRRFVVEPEEIVEKLDLKLDDKYSPPCIEEIFLVSADALSLFSLYHRKKGDYLSRSEVRDYIRQHVAAKSLASPQDNSLIQLDEVLSKFLPKSDARTHLKWDQLLELCVSRMKTGTKITFPGQEPRIVKEKLKPIEINVVKRAANKTVTLVTNLELFGIDPQELAHTIQIRVATSTTVTPNVNKKDGYQVFIQGNQVHHLSKLLLDELKLPKRFVKGLELAKKKK